MKRVIRSWVTELYLTPDGTWTKDAKMAQQFDDTAAAIAAVQRYYLHDCELVLQMGPEPSAQYDVVFPLSSHKREERAKGSSPESSNDDLRRSASGP